ncbi:hypothetical protein EVAR_85507_1 [Eumeta japonica]|uniref:Uncharacterized protein n=1 Tax=Eumeta variegata TaxID=151549 RepID=A0A4C1VCB3_EUMVA|nr:hypothetical protein EVAR_85507_1 [Eumeta japonica]
MDVNLNPGPGSRFCPPSRFQFPYFKRYKNITGSIPGNPDGRKGGPPDFIQRTKHNSGSHYFTSSSMVNAVATIARAMRRSSDDGPQVRYIYQREGEPSIPPPRRNAAELFRNNHRDAHSDRDNRRYRPSAGELMVKCPQLDTLKRRRSVAELLVQAALTRAGKWFYMSSTLFRTRARLLLDQFFLGFFYLFVHTRSRGDDEPHPEDLDAFWPSCGRFFHVNLIVEIRRLIYACDFPHIHGVYA